MKMMEQKLALHPGEKTDRLFALGQRLDEASICATFSPNEKPVHTSVEFLPSPPLRKRLGNGRGCNGTPPRANLLIIQRRRRKARTGDVERAAFDGLLTTAPVTIPGLLAFIKYVSGQFLTIGDADRAFETMTQSPMLTGG